MIKVKVRCQSCFLKIACGEDFTGTKVPCPRCGTEINIPSPHYSLGTNVRGFIIDQWLGNGAMGEVYLAHQSSMDRMIALKIVPKGNLSNNEEQQRFIREVQNLAKLRHPNIVNAIEAGQFEDCAYLAMNYIDGISVEDKIAIEGMLDEELALRICSAIASALDHAWETCQLIHRDLKPANFMIDKKNNIFLMDMGISKKVNYDTEITAFGIVMGTPYYMSPEQARGSKKLDLRSDIYSLGSSLYHMVTGYAPYSSSSTSATVMNLKLIEPPEDPRRFNPNLSSGLVRLLRFLMAKDPQNRPRDWKETQKFIAEVLDNPETALLPSKKAPTPPPPLKRTESQVILLTSVIIMVIVLLAILIYLVIS